MTMMIRTKVNEMGQVGDLSQFAGDDVLVIRTPKAVTPERTETLAKALEKPLSALEDLRRFLAEHRDLTRRQALEFTARYGNPAEKAKAYAKNLNLTPEELRGKVNEVNSLVEKRLETITQDLEKRYDELEREVEATIERVFGARSAAPAADAASPVDVRPTEGAGATEADAKKGKKPAK